MPALTGAGLADVLAERVRQIDVEGFTLAHDLAHHPGGLALAAASYLNTAIDQLVHGTEHDATEEPDTWPWEREAWRPGDARANLVKALAIGLATLDRVDAARPTEEAERFDYDIDDDGVMTALPTWQRDNKSTFLRLQLVAVGPIEEAIVADWTDEQVRQADIWAWTTHLSASDHDDIQVPPRPPHVPSFAPHDPARNPVTGEPI